MSKHVFVYLALNSRLQDIKAEFLFITCPAALQIKILLFGVKKSQNLLSETFVIFFYFNTTEFHKKILKEINYTKDHICIF